jgi:16S rRNA (cytosine967-C5)-methyltransferase
MRVTSARAHAAQILRAVLESGTTLDAALEQAGLAALDERDRGFVRLLVATVLRRLGQIDAALAACLDRALIGRARQILPILRLGAAQILFLGTPAHAAVAETVALAGQRLAPWRGLVNAVLRRLTREGADLVAQQDAARLNTPDWLWTAWTGAYGDDVTRAIAEAHLAEPPLDLTVKADPAHWAEQLDAAILPTGSLRRGLANIASLPGYGEGAWWVQDAAAALPAKLLGDVRGKLVIDLCAAPGGKTAQLAAAGARVIAVDRSADRLARLEGNLARLGLAARCIAADATTWTAPEPADCVLLDAPCTATGTIRRHPDIAHRKRPEDVARMAALQDRLLQAASAMIRPGGALVFATCSLQAEEGPARVEAFLAAHREFARDKVSPAEIGDVAEWRTPDGAVRTLPCHWAERGGIDGFFMARLRRHG